VPGKHASVVHGSLSLQFRAPGVFTHPVPGTHASDVHGALSLQFRAPGVKTHGLVGAGMAGLQTSEVQGSLSLQTNGAPGWQPNGGSQVSGPWPRGAAA